MADLQTKIVGIIDANNGQATFQQLVDGVEYPERQRVLSTVRGMEQAGLVKRNLAVDKATGTSTLTVSKVGA